MNQRNTNRELQSEKCRAARSGDNVAWAAIVALLPTGDALIDRSSHWLWSQRGKVTGGQATPGIGRAQGLRDGSLGEVNGSTVSRYVLEGADAMILLGLVLTCVGLVARFRRRREIR